MPDATWERIPPSAPSFPENHLPQRYKIKNPCSCIALLTQLSATGCVAAFLMGYNLSVLNTILPVITADFKWCGLAHLMPGDAFQEASESFQSPVDIQWQCVEARPKQSLLQSALILGAVLGSLGSGLLASALGRRGSLLLVNTGLAIGAVSSAGSMTLRQLFFSRTMTGLLAGLATVIPSIYVAEMAPPRTRPFYSLLPPLAVNLGILIGIVIGFPIVLPDIAADRHTLPGADWAFDQFWWRLMLLLPAPFALCATYMLLRCYTYDTPVFLRVRGQQQAAEQVESAVWSNLNVDAPHTHAMKIPTRLPKRAEGSEDSRVYVHAHQNGYQLAPQASVSSLELSSHPRTTESPTPHNNAVTAADKRPSAAPRSFMNEQSVDEKSGGIPQRRGVGSMFPEDSSTSYNPGSPVPTMSFLTALKRYPPLRNRLLIGWAFSILQQMSGINVFVSGSNTLFLQAGLPPQYTTAASALMALLALACSAITALRINNIPRRTMLVGGALLMSLALLPAATCHLFVPLGSRLEQITSVLSTLFFVSFYSCSYGPGLFVYLNELWPTEIKDVALAVAFGLNWVCCFLVVFCASFLSQTDAVSAFSALCAAGAFLAYVCAPETRAPEPGEIQSALTPSIQTADTSRPETELTTLP